MPGVSHTAKKLFDRNIRSARDCFALYQELKKSNLQNVNIKVNLKWLLRAAIVFTVSAIDAYFHDKVKYRVGKLSLSKLPPTLAKFEIKLDDLQEWKKAKREGNFLRNEVVKYLSTKPLQSTMSIAETLKLVDIKSFWSSIEPDKIKREDLFKHFDALIHRRNKISHEADRLATRGSGKKLRPIAPSTVLRAIKFAVDLVDKTENVFPN